MTVTFLLVVPVVDQLACFYCGPSAETSATAKPVPHSEDECALQDGFERSSPLPDEEPVHIHFCLLHATSVDLTKTTAIHFESHSDEICLTWQQAEDYLVSDFFHPPTLA